jgi:hypothetical protein
MAAVFPGPVKVKRSLLKQPGTWMFNHAVPPVSTIQLRRCAHALLMTNESVAVLPICNWQKSRLVVLTFDYREAIGGAYLQKCKDVFQMIDAVITEK